MDYGALISQVRGGVITTHQAVEQVAYYMWEWTQGHRDALTNWYAALTSLRNYCALRNIDIAWD